MSIIHRGAAVAALTASLFVAGCGMIGGANGSCTSADAQAVITDVVRKEVEKKALRDLRRDDGSSIASIANLRASLALIELAIEDVRTSKEDPDSTKKFCAGSFKAVIPTTMLADAESTYSLLEVGTIADYAERQGMEQAANAFTYDLEFSVQPTDDKKKIFGEIEQPDALVNFLSEMVVAHLASGEVAQAKAAEAQAIAEQKRLNDEAENAQRQAVMVESKTEYDLARQTLTALWAAIPEEVQGRLTANQTAWNQRKRADCNLESAQYSTDPTEREASRLRCDARLTRERITALRPYAGY